MGCKEKHTLHGDSVEDLRNKTLYELSDPGMKDGRTEIQAWCDALAVAKQNNAMIAAAHEKLVSLGFEKGLRDLDALK